jgi:single-strand DNA-binding protein
MPNYSDITIMGHIGRIEIKEFGDNKLATFSLAVSRKVKGEKVTDWFDVKAWGFNANFAENYLEKGSAILVRGEPQIETWEDKNTGSKRSKLVVNAQKITFAGGRAEAEPVGNPVKHSEPNLDDMPF